ncbi:MAG: 3D domain-containing protein [Bacillota bacterium]|nr:3D domain-containing protein [Bacillota bacterium]
MLQKLKDTCKRYFSKGPKAIFGVALPVIIAASISVAAYTERKTLHVYIDGKESKIVTYRSDLKDVLQRNKIVLGPKDKIEPGLNAKVTDGEKIYIKKAVDVVVNVDGKKLQIKTAEDNVNAMLKTEKIALSDVDKISPSQDTKVSKGMNVVITRVDSKVVTETKPIDFSTEVQKDGSMGTDEQKVVQEGQAGEKEISTKIVYEDGKEVSRQQISEVVKKEPVKKVMVMGTLNVFKPTRGGRILYTSKISARATAYTADYRFGITASGARVKRDVNGYSSIAVDPRVIPLGTKLYVPGYGYGIAQDTGGAIKGNRIDLFFNSEADCYNWGVKDVDVYIVQ